MSVVVVIISANTEWRIVRQILKPVSAQETPYGECFECVIGEVSVVFVQGGWGKVSAAASAQYAIGRWQPQLLVNLGTCGGFEGQIERGEIVLAERTLIYDLIEQMNADPFAAIQHYSVDLDLSWLAPPYPHPVRRGVLVSADRDICPQDIPGLIDRYGAFAGDWESGAIAWVAARHSVRCLILRGVSDLVGEGGGEAYQAVEVFQAGTRVVMTRLLGALPAWLLCVK
jgi:adenosylhomocysteine nucleosidase